MKKYIITGPPGSGKSSIMFSGEMDYGYHVVREVAEDYIKKRQAAGIKEPWTEANFQERILEIQVQRESRIPVDAGIVWLDRGIPDGLAYVKEGAGLYDRIIDEFKKSDQIMPYERTCFLIMPLKAVETNEVRRENYDEAIAIGNNLEGIYKKLGFEVIKIDAGKPFDLEGRVRQIVDVVGKNY